jgi:hypothetical protein
MSKIDAALTTAKDFQESLEFEELISDLVSRFIRLPPGEVDSTIEDALCRVCEFLDIDLGVLWQWSTEVPDLVMPTHVYHARGVPRPTQPNYR